MICLQQGTVLEEGDHGLALFALKGDTCQLFQFTPSAQEKGHEYHSDLQ